MRAGCQLNAQATEACCPAAGHFKILSQREAVPLVAFSLNKTVGKVRLLPAVLVLCSAWFQPAC